jgi:hypothetical protein
MHWDSVNYCLLTCWPYAGMFNGGEQHRVLKLLGVGLDDMEACQLPVPGATWIDMTKMQVWKQKNLTETKRQEEAVEGLKQTRVNRQVSELDTVSKETLLLFPHGFRHYFFPFSKARQEICRENLLLLQGSKLKWDWQSTKENKRVKEITRKRKGKNNN